MAKGVSRDFIDLLARQRDLSKRRLKQVPVLVVLGYVVAELADLPALGVHVWTYLAVLAVAGPLCYLGARHLYAGYGEELKADWSAWMAAAPGADSVVEARDRALGEPGLLASIPTAAGLLVFANVASLLLLWFEAKPAPYVSFATVVLDAAAIAALAAWHLKSLFWSQAVDQAVHELWRDGEIGIYGQVRRGRSRGPTRS